MTRSAPHDPSLFSPLMTHLLTAAAIVIAAGLAMQIGQALMGRLERARDGGPRDGRRTTLYRLLTSVLRYVVGFVALLMILDLFGVPTTSLLAGAGVLGLAVSFGAQGVVQDVVTGIFLLYEDQYAVGDAITLPALALSGTVTELGIRLTRLKGLTGEDVDIPNRLILEVQNHSRGQTSVTVTVPISPAADPAEVDRAFTALASDAAEKVPGLSVQGITGFAPGQVLWAVSAPVRYQDAYATGLTLNRAVADALYHHKIPLAGMLESLAPGPGTTP